MDAISNTIGLCYESMLNNYPDKFLTATCFDTYPNYANYAQENISSWFLNWFEQHPGNQYSTPEYPNGYYIPHHMKYQQDPVYWIINQEVDAIMPMKYTMNDSLWNREVNTWKQFLESDISKINMGLGWYTAER